MSSRKHHKRRFTTHDISRYLEGTMLPAEMHELESAALADPFLADAIKGMEFSHTNYGKDNFNHHVSELRGRLYTKQHSPKLGLVWKVAAILFLLITGVAITVIIQDNSKQELATVNAVQHEEVLVEDTGSIPEKIFKTDTAIIAAAEAAKIPASKKPPARRQAQAYSEMSPQKPSENHAAMDEKVGDDESVSSAPPGRNEKEVAAAQAGIEESRRLQGRAAGVDVSRTPQTKDTFDQHAARLDEVVVVGYGISRREKKVNETQRPAVNSNRRFAPLGGWQAFQNYIVSNIQLPDSLAGRRGAVKISFGIGSGGNPKDIRIERAFSPLHDAEAIRLLSAGPTWKILKGKDRRLQIEISF